MTAEDRATAIAALIDAGVTLEDFVAAFHAARPESPCFATKEERDKAAGFGYYEVDDGALASRTDDGRVVWVQAWVKVEMDQ